MSFKIGNHEIDNGLCLTHGLSVSAKVKCPESTLNSFDWETFYTMNERSAQMRSAFSKMLSHPKVVAAIEQAVAEGNLVI